MEESNHLKLHLVHYIALVETKVPNPKCMENVNQWPFQLLKEYILWHARTDLHDAEHMKIPINPFQRGQSWIIYEYGGIFLMEKIRTITSLEWATDVLISSEMNYDDEMHYVNDCNEKKTKKLPEKL